MNKDNNRRFQETEKKIKKAYGILAAEKPVEQITVTDICELAGIHRTSFYGHYQDIPDLLEQLTLEQLMNFLKDPEEKSGKWSMRDCFLEQLAFYKKYQETVSGHLEGNSSYEVLNELLNLPLYAEGYDQAFGLHTETEKAYHRIFFQNGYMAVIRQWIRGGCREPEEEIADLICSIFTAKE